MSGLRTIRVWSPLFAAILITGAAAASSPTRPPGSTVLVPIPRPIPLPLPPAPVLDGLPARSLAIGNTTTAVVSGGVVYTWGRDLSWPHAPNAASWQAKAKTPASQNAQQVVVGDNHVCYWIPGSGEDMLPDNVYCYGANEKGQLGSGVGVDSPDPRQVMLGGGSASRLWAGSNFTCALVQMGGASQLQCWGGFAEANAPTHVLTPRVLVADGVKWVAAGANHVCATNDVDRVWCFGSNSMGQAQQGTALFVDPPVEVPLPTYSGFLGYIYAGGDATCALTGGKVVCWGSNGRGSFGTAPVQGASPLRFSSPVAIPFPTMPSQIALGRDFLCSMFPPSTAGGINSVNCWGENASGQLGNGTTNATPLGYPAHPDLAGPGEVAVTRGGGPAHACAIVTGGQVWCWGSTADSAIGNWNAQGAVVTSPLRAWPPVASPPDGPPR